MSVDRSPSANALIFNIDTAAPVDAPPVLFYSMRAPCACGRALADCTYTFFPSSVFVHGTCQVCGAQTAIFAPEMKGQQEPLSSVIAKRMARLTAEMVRVYGEDVDTIISEFLNYLAAASHAESA